MKITLTKDQIIKSRRIADGFDYTLNGASVESTTASTSTLISNATYGSATSN